VLCAALFAGGVGADVDVDVGAGGGALRWLSPVIARLTVGLVFFQSGWGKLHSLDQVTSYFTELGLPAPAYHHHRLVLDQDGAKLAKSTRSTALRELRAGGATPADIRRMIALR